jgi:hypothetical protein
MVCFVPDAEAGTAGPRSTGWTDEKGHYQLARDRPYKPGVVAGKHRVTVLDPVAFEGRKGARKAKRMQFDFKYTMPAQTPLRADVQSPGPQTIDLNIQ